MRSFPKVILVLIAAIALCAYLAWSVFGKISEKIAPAKAEPVKTLASPGDATRSALQTMPEPVKLGYIDDRVDFVPRVSHVPESAPAYDALRQVVNMPVVAGGICKGAECKCYTQQGTPLQLTSQECRRAVESPAFDHYNKPQPIRPAASGLGTGAGNTPYAPPETGPAAQQSAAVVSVPAGRAVNAAAEAKPPLVLPPGSPVQPTQATGTVGTIPALSLQSSYRRS